MDAKGLDIERYIPTQAIEAWVSGPGVPPPNERGAGYLVSKRGIPLVVGYLIDTNASWALCEHIQTNPDAPLYLRSRATAYLVKYLVAMTEARGYRNLIGIMIQGRRSMEKLYKRCGADIIPATLASRRF
jgi:hypothetical protein